MEKLTYTVSEAARLLGIPKSLLYREIKTGNSEIPVKKIGSRIVIPAKLLAEYINK